MRTITITEVAPNDFAIFDGKQLADRLTSEEALRVAATWLLAPEKEMPYGKTPESYWEMERRIRKNIEAQLRPVDRLALRA